MIERQKMTTRAKSIIARLATWAYVLCAALSVVFTISYFRSDGGPQVIGYAVVFLLLFLCAVCAVGCIAVAGAWKDNTKIVCFGALAWPIPIYLSALVIRAMFAS
jgi:small-conductance mechanosensitive channel